jgi:hypothetical protein
MRAQHHHHRCRLREIVKHFESDTNLHSKHFPAGVPRNGYETVGYKASVASFDQMHSGTEKTIANCCKSAHATPMSRQADVSVRRYAGPPT